MTFSQLKPGSSVHVLEITGTFKKNTVYNLGTTVSVSNSYDEPIPPNQFTMQPIQRRKLVDIVIACDGEQKKLSVSEDKTITTDNSIGLTIATDKNQIVDMVKQSYMSCKIKKEAASKYDEEMKRCEDILKLLNVADNPVVIPKDFKEFDELKNEVKELKKLILENTLANVHPELKTETPEKESEI